MYKTTTADVILDNEEEDSPEARRIALDAFRADFVEETGQEPDFIRVRPAFRLDLDDTADDSFGPSAETDYSADHRYGVPLPLCVDHHLPREMRRVSWEDRAACRGLTDLFFGEEFQNTAKAVCASCPVQRQCCIYGVVTEEKSGIWGGLNPPERARLIAKNHIKTSRIVATDKWERSKAILSDEDRAEAVRVTLRALAAEKVSA